MNASLAPTVTHRADVSARALVLRAVAAAIKPKSQLTVSEWADANRILVEGADSEPGRWKTSRNPPVREIMDQLSEHSPATKVVVMGPTQWAKTAIATNWLGYIATHAKGAVGVYMPTENTLSDWQAQKFAPMADHSALVRDAFSVGGRGENNNRRKTFAGGAVYFRTAGSPADLKNVSLRYAIVDEIDEYGGDTEQGDKLGLIEARMSIHADAKIYVPSTPTMKGASHVEEAFEGGDKRRYHVPCPHCGELQVLKQSNLQWQKKAGSETRVESVWYACEVNGCVIEHHHKPTMLQFGRWIAEVPDAPYPSYHINALYTPIGLGRSWLQLAEEWIDAQGSTAKLQRYINTRLAEPFADQTGDLKGNALLGRAEPYPLRTVPPGCLVITVGVDVQSGAASRLEIQVVGHGRNNRTWTLDYHVIPGSMTSESTWAALADYVNAVQFINTAGHVMRSEACGIDTGGHATHEVYVFVRDAKVVRPMALKGHSKPGQVILGKPSRQDVNWRGQTIKHGVWLYMVGVDTLKQQLYGRLHDDDGKAPHDRKVRFSAELPPSFFDGLVAETFNPRRNRWEKKKGKKNEPLDTWNYAVAASHHPELYIHKWRTADWARRAKMLGDTYGEDSAPANEGSHEKESETVTTAKPAAPPRNNVLNNLLKQRRNRR